MRARRLAGRLGAVVAQEFLRAKVLNIKTANPHQAQSGKSRFIAVAPYLRYGTIVIDPPWPMKKIERKVRPNQVEFDYPTMEYEQLRAFRATFQPLAADDCHVFMWTTQRFLPMALRLFEDSWCHKNTLGVT